MTATSMATGNERAATTTEDRWYGAETAELGAQIRQGICGGRILATMLREMDRRGARYGLETMCIGGGQALAAVFERAA